MKEGRVQTFGGADEDGREKTDPYAREEEMGW